MTDNDYYNAMQHRIVSTILCTLNAKAVFDWIEINLQDHFKQFLLGKNNHRLLDYRVNDYLKPLRMCNFI